MPDLDIITQQPPDSISMWSGLLEDLPDNWHLADGLDGTEDLSDLFIRGVPPAGAVQTQGGEKDHLLTVPEMPNHTHGVLFPGGANHVHTLASNFSGPDAIRGEGVPSDSRVATSSTGSFAGQPEMDPTSAGGGIDTRGGTPHENQPAFFELAYVQKVN